MNNNTAIDLLGLLRFGYVAQLEHAQRTGLSTELTDYLVDVVAALDKATEALYADEDDLR